MVLYDPKLMVEQMFYITLKTYEMHRPEKILTVLLQH